MAAPTSRFAALFSATVRVSVSSGNSGAGMAAFVRPVPPAPQSLNASPLCARTTTKYWVSGVRPVIVVARPVIVVPGPVPLRGGQNAHSFSLEAPR